MAMNPSSTIMLNGEPHPLERETTVEELLASLGMVGRPVVVELNEQAVFPRDYPTLQVLPGARVEIVALAAGG